MGCVAPRRTRGLPRLLLACAVLALLVAALLPAAPSWAQTASAPTSTSSLTPVRVGYFYNGDFMHKDENGDYEGYDVEYYYAVASYAGWDVSFVDYPNLESALAGLRAGDIDIMSGLSKTAEREASFLVSSQKMCTSRIAVQTRATDDRFSAGDVAGMANLTCGILRGSNVVTLYQQWCVSNGITPHVVEYDSILDRNAALFAGEVDAIAAGSTIEGAQKIAEFPSLDLFFMFNTGRADLKAQADNAMAIMSIGNPTYASDLFLKYFPASRNETPTFSAAEKDFIAQRDTVKVAVLADDAPYSLAASDGTVSGILPDYFAHLAELTGLTFECVPYASRDEALDALASGDVCLFSKYTYDAYDANVRHLVMTTPYLEQGLVQITRVGTENVTSIATPQSILDSVRETVASQDSTATVRGCTGGLSSFSMLRSGSVDAVVCSQATASWLLNRNRTSDYVISSFGSETWKVCCALNVGHDGNMLRSIIDKSIMVDGSYITKLVTADTLQDSADLVTVFDRVPVAWIAMAAIVFFLLMAVAVVALVIIVRRRRTERELAVQQAEVDRREAQIAAEARANEVQHNFFSTVSHDMRTPLNGIVGFTDLALSSQSCDQVRDYLGKIRSSGVILSNLVNDTLVMSRLESGGYVFNPTRVDLRMLLDETASPVRITCEERGISFVSNIDRLAGHVAVVDRVALQKVVLNLLSNAEKFTEPGGSVRLTARLDPPQPDSEKSVLVVAVTDTGAGISPEFVPHVFEAFSQENSASAGSSGAGLGLAVVKALVEGMGGTVAVESAKGRGSTFTVRLPLAEEDFTTTGGIVPGDGAAAGAATSASEKSLAGCKMLVCEDNALNLEIIRSILERAGAEVVSEPNGEAGLAEFERSAVGEYRAVLLDLRMPVMDGETTATRIRGLARPDAKKVVIVAVSADAYPENVGRCLAAGMDGHVAKPVNPTELISVLLGAMGQ